LSAWRLCGSLRLREKYRSMRRRFRRREVVLRDPPESTLETKQRAITGLADVYVLGYQVPSLGRCFNQGVFESKRLVGIHLAPWPIVAQEGFDHSGLSHILEFEPVAGLQLSINLSVPQNNGLRLIQVNVRERPIHDRQRKVAAARIHVSAFV